MAGVPHSSPLTNHRIPAKTGMRYSTAQPVAAGVPDLVVLNRPPESKAEVPPVTLLEAYREMTERGAPYGMRYRNLLEQLSRSAADHPRVLALLGRNALRDPGPEGPRKAVEYISKALAAGSADPIVYADLSEALSRAGKLPEAAAALQRGIAAAPYSSSLYRSLIRLQMQLGEHDRARETMKQYAELFPESTFLRGLASSLRP
jgi:tetratricopeptide (TPR) repeat protein